MKKYLYLLLIVSIFSCNQTTEEYKPLQDEVIKIHDNLMVKGESIMNNKEGLNKLLESAESADADGLIPDSEEFYKELNNHLQSLEKADESMMNWMNNFNPDYSEKSSEEIISYLNQQKKAILEVEKQTNIALKNSDEFISKYQKNNIAK